ncbi:hypothetical protein BDR04DRAFT_1115424 [Suillus decipiens]|nr:hypothetical protein BDR04DRAFT_1115424 [Suillus decipiens]
MSDSSTPSTIHLTDFTVWDATNVLEYTTSHFAAIWIDCDRSHVPPTPAYKASFVQHLQWEADCSLHNPELSSNHRVVPRYSHDWWKYCFDTLALPLPFLDVNKVLEMTQDHFEQLPMRAMLLPGTVVTSQVEGDPLLNQILAVRAHMQHLGNTLASMLEEKIQMAAAATSTMSQP